MSPDKKRKRIQQFGELLETPKKSRSSSLSPTSIPRSETPANIAAFSTIISGSSDNEVAGPSTLGQLVHTSGEQSPNLQSPCVEHRIDLKEAQNKQRQEDKTHDESYRKIYTCCENSFNDLLKSFETSNDQASTQILLDQLGRFRVWAGNAGVHGTQSSSLDYHLRDASHIRAELTELLEELSKNLKEALNLNLNKVDKGNYSSVSLAIGEEFMAKLGPLKDQEAGLSEFEYLMSEITHIITCLYKFTVTIQHPAPKDRLHKIALTNISYFEDLDIKHIDKMLCPMDPQNNFRVAKYLSERLGKANTKRRQLLNYDKAQPKETPPNIDNFPSNNELSDTLKSTTSIMESGSVRDPRKTPDPKWAATGYTRMKPQTTVPTINIELSKEDKLEEDEDRLSQTSYASSTNHTVKIRVPPPPTDNVFRGEPFKCSYCFKMIKITSRKDWKRHVFRDLQPYICTFPDCPQADKWYGSRSEWFDHEVQLHRRGWYCEACSKTFPQKTLFQEHIEAMHSERVTKGHFEAIISRCERADIACPLCGIKFTLKTLEKHLGLHLQEIALFALPPLETCSSKIKSKEVDYSSDDLSTSEFVPVSTQPVGAHHLEVETAIKAQAILQQIRHTLDQLLGPNRQILSQPTFKYRSYNREPEPSCADQERLIQKPRNSPTNIAVLSKLTSGYRPISDNFSRNPAYATGDQQRMSSSRTEGSKRLWGFQEAPFGHKRSRNSSPGPPSTPSPAFGNTLTNTLDTKSIATPVPTKSEAQKAIEEYIDNLSDDDKIAFQSASDVMQKLGELKQGESRISRSHINHMQKAQKVLRDVKQFVESVAVGIQLGPQIYSLVVGGLNCVLTLALEYIEFFEILTDMVERITDHLTYLAKYAIALVQDSEVQKALVAVYSDLLDFYVQVRKLFNYKEGRSSYAKGFKHFLKITWEPFEAQFQCIEAKFIHHTRIVVRLAGNEDQRYLLQKEAQGKQGQEDKRRRKVLEWLSSHDFDETHERYFNKRFQNTGQWLLDDTRFRSWRDGAQSSLLWCYGAPGSGKTILASLVIDHLSARYFSTNTGITFIYCNYTESRSPLEYIRLVIKQLCRRIKSLPPELHKTYEQHYMQHSQPGFQELQDVFLASIQHFDSVYFIVDALDECTLDPRVDLCEFLTGIVGLTIRTIIKVFVASRQELNIERAFSRKSFPTIEVEAAKVDCDIKLYVTAQIEQRLLDGSLTLNSMMLKDKILTTLTTNASGMFLWAELQLNAISSQVSYNVEETLHKIPHDINALYERILDTIERKPLALRELAKRALLFLAYAREPVSIDSLALAIAVKDHAQSLEELRSSISTERSILSVCGNLLSIDNTDPKVRRVCFVHFSVPEFLTRHQSKLLQTFSLEYEEAHREIAQICITFLLILYSNIHDCCTATESSFVNNYILPALPHHLLAGNLNCLPSNDGVIHLISSFFALGPPLLGPRIWSHDERVIFTFSPSVLALVFNLPGTYQRYNPRLSYVKTLDKKLLVPIYGRGGDFMQVSDNRLAMHYAIGQLNSVAIGERLYTHGYPIDYSHRNSDGPLNTFNLGQELQAVPEVCRLTPLYLVNNEEVARFLLDRGASVSPQAVDRELPNLLEYLIRCGDTKLIQLLLDKGADINAQGGEYGNALQAAAFNGNMEAMQLLLDNGADVNAQGGHYGNALQATACIGEVDAIQLLLDRGADVNAQGGLYGFALQAAASNGNIKAVLLLIDWGADVNAQGGHYGNALQAAASNGNVEVLSFLLDCFAHVNAQGGLFGNALQASVCYGNIEAVQLLLARGADVNAQGGMYGTALQAAFAPPHRGIYKDALHIAKVLLDHGADVTAYVPDSRYGDALSAATELFGGELFGGDKKLVEFMKLLEEKGWKGDRLGTHKKGPRV